MNSPLCHTLKRGVACNVPSNFNNTFGETRTLAHESVEAHLWHDAVPCAYAVMSGNMVTFSYVALFALIALVL